MLKPMIIGIDGINGSGKSTVIAHLQRMMRAFNIASPIVMKQPNLKRFGSKLDVMEFFDIDPHSDEVFPFLSLAQEISFQRKLAKLRDEGNVILTDRTPLTTLVYNTKTLKLSRQAAILYNELMTTYRHHLYLRPDLIFLLTAKVDTCIKRIQKRGNIKEKFFKIDKAGMETLQRAFLVFQPLPEVYIVKNEGTDIQIPCDHILNVLKESKWKLKF